MLLALTFFDDISMGKSSMSFLVKLQANENIWGGFPLLITLKIWILTTSNIAKKTAASSFFGCLLTEQILYHIIFGRLHYYEITLVKNWNKPLPKKRNKGFRPKKIYNIKYAVVCIVTLYFEHVDHFHILHTN